LLLEKDNSMSVIEQLSLDMQNRRTAERLRVAGTVPVIFGRNEGVIVDLSERGARIRHAGAVRRGSSVRVSFSWERDRFSAAAEVLASRVISLGAGPSFETRVRFTSFDGASESVLARTMKGIAGRDVRRWVANLRGWSPEDSSFAHPLVQFGSFLRCRLRGSWWERKVTNDATQPEDGFLLPFGSTEEEILTLCDTYERGDDEERQFLRLTAAAAIEYSQESRPQA
jgi:hypothetical protein